MSATVKLVFFLIAFSGSGMKSPFTLTRLAAFADRSACEQAVKAVHSAVSAAEKDVGGGVEFGCIPSDKLAAMMGN